MDCVSYLLLFHSLLGVMTVNTMIGIMAFLDGHHLAEGVLHLASVFGFLVVVFVHQIMLRIPALEVHTKNVRICLVFELALVLVYTFIGSFLYRRGGLAQANLAAFFLTCLGSTALYIQTVMGPKVRKLPVSTVVMTVNYQSLMRHLATAFCNGEGSAEARRGIKDFLWLHSCFWSGVVLMAWAVRYVDFLALLFPCLMLSLLILVPMVLKDSERRMRC